MKSETRARTVLIGVRFTPDEYSAAETMAEGAGISVPELVRRALAAAPSDQAHRYASTACHHGHHADCATGGTRWDGTSKTPAQCKWCDAKCECQECDHTVP